MHPIKLASSWQTSTSTYPVLPGSFETFYEQWAFQTLGIKKFGLRHRAPNAKDRMNVSLPRVPQDGNQAMYRTARLASLPFDQHHHQNTRRHHKLVASLQYPIQGSEEDNTRLPSQTERHQLLS